MQPIFAGRCNRAKYVWTTVLIGLCVGLLAVLLGYAINPVDPVVALVCFVLLSSVTVKRLHDVNLSGWFYLVFLFPGFTAPLSLGLVFIRGTRGPNKFGTDPLSSTDANVVEQCEYGGTPG